MSLTAEQYRAQLEAQRALVYRGVHPSVAGQLVRRAAQRVAQRGGMGCNGDDCCGSCRENGLGRIQMRSLRRDLDPTIKPRPVMAGEQCVRIQEVPGDETRLYRQLDDYRSRGWNVMEIQKTKGFPSVAVYWACPPGRVPMESQGQILQSQAWGAPLYVAGVGEGATPDVLAQMRAYGDLESVKAVREAITPWLWVTSLIGFGMGLMNTRRIAIMFRKHLGGRKRA